MGAKSCLSITAGVLPGPRAVSFRPAMPKSQMFARRQFRRLNGENKRKTPSVSHRLDVKAVVASVSILALLIPGLSLHTYLQEIGWGRLLFDALGDRGGLVTLAYFSLTFMFAGLVTACFPSIAIGFLLLPFDNDKPVPRKVIQACAASAMLWLLCFWSLAYLMNGYAIALSTGVILSFCFCFLFSHRQDVARSMSWLPVRIRAQTSLLIVCAIVCYSSASLVIPVGVLGKFVSAEPTLLAQMLAAGALSLVAFLGVLPGLVFLESNNRRVPLLTLLRGPSIAMLFTGMLIIVLLPGSIRNLSYAALREASIYSTEASLFLLKDKDLRPAFREAGFSLPSESDVPAIVKAHLRFSFHGTLLLCNTPYDPRSPEASRNKAVRSQAGQGCVPLSSDGVTELTRGATDKEANGGSEGPKAQSLPGAS